MEKVSGCIVTYNNIDVIEDCIRSILQCTKGVDFTLYVVDNGSTDGTISLIEKKFPEVILIQNDKNYGFGHGHNRVIEMLDSDYHAVINPDITLSMDTISALCEELKVHSDYMMITPKIVNVDGTEQHLPKYCPTVRYVIISKFKPFRYLRKRYTREEEHLSAPTSVEFCTGCFFVMPTKEFRELGGFDPRYFMYCEDADLSRRARKKGQIIFYPLVSATHQWKRDNTGNLKGISRFLGSLFKYFLRWGFQF